MCLVFVVFFLILRLLSARIDVHAGYNLGSTRGLFALASAGFYLHVAEAVGSRDLNVVCLRRICDVESNSGPFSDVSLALTHLWESRRYSFRL